MKIYQLAEQIILSKIWLAVPKMHEFENQLFL